MKVTIKEEITTRIDEVKCNGCGLCVKVCPFEDTITIDNGIAQVTGENSINCGHCVAACPNDAISVGSLTSNGNRYHTIETDKKWMPFGEYDTGQLVRLMGSRRSCRNFQSEHVDKSILLDLVEMGKTAPSGTNSQKWTFTIVQSKDIFERIADEIVAFFSRLNRISENLILRKLFKWIGKPELEVYYEEIHDLVEKSIQDWQQSKIDRLFYGAPAAIIVGSRPGGSTPVEDSLLATQNILLGAHSMGLGTCLIGFAVEAISKTKKIKRMLSIPDEEEVHSVISIGYPAETYKKVAGRKETPIRYIN